MRWLGPTGHTWLQSSIPRSQMSIKDSSHLQKPYSNKQDLSKPFFSSTFFGALSSFAVWMCPTGIQWKSNVTKKKVFQCLNKQKLSKVLRDAQIKLL